MRPYVRLVRIVIKDGNRTVNWDFPEEMGLMEVLNRWNFKWEPDSVRVFGMPIPDNLLTESVMHFVEASKAMARYTGALWVTMKGIPEKNAKKKQEVVESVG